MNYVALVQNVTPCGFFFNCEQNQDLRVPVKMASFLLILIIYLLCVSHSTNNISLTFMYTTAVRIMGRLFEYKSRFHLQRVKKTKDLTKQIRNN